MGRAILSKGWAIQQTGMASFATIASESDDGIVTSPRGTIAPDESFDDDHEMRAGAISSIGWKEKLDFVGRSITTKFK